MRPRLAILIRQILIGAIIMTEKDANSITPDSSKSRSKRSIIAMLFPSGLTILLLGIGSFYLFNTGIICSAKFEPEGSFSLAACDQEAITPEALRRIFATIDDADAEEYAEAVAINDTVIHNLIEINKRLLTRREILSDLIREVDDLDSAQWSHILNDKTYFSTTRTKLAQHLAEEVARLDEKLEKELVTGGEVDFKSIHEDWRDERPLLSHLRREALLGRGPFKPVSKQFRASLPLKDSQPEGCIVYIPRDYYEERGSADSSSIFAYQNRFVLIENNRSGNSVIAFTRPGIAANHAVTLGGSPKMLVNADFAARLGLREDYKSTSDYVSLFVISAARAERQARECYIQMSRLYRSNRPSYMTSLD